jgi:hypothetical protein
MIGGTGRWSWMALAALLWLVGCPQADDDDASGDDDATGDDDTGDDDTTEVDPIHVEIVEGCENLDPRHCSLPYPSDRYLAEDGDTVTGYRLAIEPEFLPEPVDTDVFDFTPYERLDGFSPATQLMVLWDSPADLSDAALVDDIGRSLEDDSPTVIVDLADGSRIPHWVENDYRAQYEDETVLYIRLAGILEEDHAYAVALRDLADADGETFEPSDVFAALRDGVPTDAEEIEDRREGFEEMFAILEDAGVERASLQLAWRFHTASGEAIRRDMLHIRQDALDRLGADGIGCTVTSTEDGYGGDGKTWRRVRGTYTVPLYMDSTEPPARFVRGGDDLPAYQGEHEIEFTVILPQTLVDGGAHPGPLVTFGHGLLGNGEGTISSGDVRDIAYRGEVILLATDWDGMSSEDVPTVGLALADPNMFPHVTERLQQGMVNQIALTRTFAGICSDLPEFQAEGVDLIDSSRLFYTGVSQGGIFGGTLTTISPDIDRGVLLVNGAVFPVMMERSIDYAPYYPLFEFAWQSRLDQAILLPLAQHLWDASEPSGYLQHAIDGLPGIGPKEVLSLSVVNDSQVPNVSTNQAMRMAGVPVIEGSALEPWGFPVETAPYAGSALVYVDMGDRDVPEGNVFPEVNDNGHSEVGKTDIALQIIQPFLETGVVQMPCEGVCDPD